jgi:hypothetical protein
VSKVILEPCTFNFKVLGGTVETALSLQVLELLMVLLEPSAVFCEFNQQAQCMYMCLITVIRMIEYAYMMCFYFIGLHEM